MIRNVYRFYRQEDSLSEVGRLNDVIDRVKPKRLGWVHQVKQHCSQHVADMEFHAATLGMIRFTDVLLCRRVVVCARSGQYQGYMAFRRLDGVTAKPHKLSDIEEYVRQAFAKQYIDNNGYELLLNGTGEVAKVNNPVQVTQEMLDDCVVERDPFDVSSKTDQEIVDEANGLAAQFYKAHGYEVPEGYKFHEATHPHEISMWNMAVLAYEYLTGTDLNDALSGIEDEEDDQ